MPRFLFTGWSVLTTAIILLCTQPILAQLAFMVGLKRFVYLSGCSGLLDFALSVGLLAALLWATGACLQGETPTHGLIFSKKWSLLGRSIALYGGLVVLTLVASWPLSYFPLGQLLIHTSTIKDFTHHAIEFVFTLLFLLLLTPVMTHRAAKIVSGPVSWSKLWRYGGYTVGICLLAALIKLGVDWVKVLVKLTEFPYPWPEVVQGSFGARVWLLHALSALHAGVASKWLAALLDPLLAVTVAVTYCMPLADPQSNLTQLRHHLIPAHKQQWCAGAWLGLWGVILGVVGWYDLQQRITLAPYGADTDQTVPIYQIGDFPAGRIQFVGPGATLLLQQWDERLLILDGWLQPRLGRGFTYLRAGYEPNASYIPGTCASRRYPDLVTLTPDASVLIKVVALKSECQSDQDVHVLEIWQTAQAQLLHTIPIDRQRIRRFAVANNGKKVGVLDESGVQIHQAESLVWQVPATLPLNRADTFAFSPDGTVIASGAISEPIRLRQLDNGELLDFSFSEHLQEPRSWGIQPKREGPDLIDKAQNSLEHLLFSPDGQLLVITTKRTLYVASGQGGQLKFSLPFDHEFTTDTYQCPPVFSPDGLLLAACIRQSGWWGQTRPGRVYVVAVATGAIVRELPMSSDSVTFSANGHYFATSRMDNFTQNLAIFDRRQW